MDEHYPHRLQSANYVLSTRHRFRQVNSQPPSRVGAVLFPRYALCTDTGQLSPPIPHSRGRADTVQVGAVAVAGWNLCS